jgi:hypothetical protein
MKKIDAFISKIQEHKNEGFLMILISLLGLSLVYSFESTNQLIYSLAMLPLVVVYMLFGVRLIYRYYLKYR